MKIVAFGASASKKSINKEFAAFAAKQFSGEEIEVLDLNDFPLPLYTVDVEKESGIPGLVKSFQNKLYKADLIIISLAEHNGSYTTAFKNLFDWLSRYNRKMFEGKKVVLLSTAPGARGGKSVMEAALVRFPIHGADIIGHFSLPHYKDNYAPGKGIIHPELNKLFTDFIFKTRREYELSESKS